MKDERHLHEKSVSDAGPSPTVLVLEDDKRMRDLITKVLADVSAEVVDFEDAQEALDYLETKGAAVVVTDLRVPKIDGMEVLRFAKQHDRHIQVIVVTGYATVDSAVAALKEGAFDYVCKPFENVELRHTVVRALDHWLLTCENLRLRKENQRISESHSLIGRSKAMAYVHRMIEAASSYDCSVLISGESGSGKELVAHQIHSRSTRRDNEFVAINCAALPEQIIESELFGYQKGAFTGAERAKQGLIEKASGGTLFLDELNNASLSLQAKLLRVLQEGTLYRLGDTEPRQVDIRVLAASNEDLTDSIKERRLREDLYYRLRVVEIVIPPLRERRDDIPLLANYFLSKHAKRFGEAVRGMTTAALGALMRHEWPGNVRELENAVQRMLILSADEVVDVDGLPPDIVGGEAAIRAIDYMQPQSLEEIEIHFIRKALRDTDGDRRLCAEILGIDKSTLWRKIKRYNLESA